jgi:hypothetical protein
MKTYETDGSNISADDERLQSACRKDGDELKLYCSASAKFKGRIRRSAAAEDRIAHKNSTVACERKISGRLEFMCCL